jgi:hypothetical protein
MQKLEIQTEAFNYTYLGMPMDVGRSPVSVFRFLYDRMWKRINGCSDRPMSRAGKEVFLKSFIQAIPSYVMSCFQLPLTTCDKNKFKVWMIESARCIGDLEVCSNIYA